MSGRTCLPSLTPRTGGLGWAPPSSRCAALPAARTCSWAPPPPWLPPRPCGEAADEKLDGLAAAVAAAAEQMAQKRRLVAGLSAPSPCKVGLDPASAPAARPAALGAAKPPSLAEPCGLRAFQPSEDAKGREVTAMCAAEATELPIGVAPPAPPAQRMQPPLAVTPRPTAAHVTHPAPLQSRSYIS